MQLMNGKTVYMSMSIGGVISIYMAFGRAIELNYYLFFVLFFFIIFEKGNTTAYDYSGHFIFIHYEMVLMLTTFLYKMSSGYPIDQIQ